MKYVLASFVVLVLLAGGLYFATGPTPAPKERVVKIGIISNPPALDPALEGFRTQMKKLGYEEGKTVHYTITTAGKDLEETKKKASELIDAKPDILYVMGVLAARAAKDATAQKSPELPVVFGVVSNPVAGKLVKSITSSGNNLTGVTPANEVIVAKRLELFLDMAPQTRRIVFPWNDPNTTGVENLREAARNLGVALVEKQVANVAEFQEFLNTFPFEKTDGFFRATDSVSAQIMQKIIDLTLQKKIALAGTNANDVERGALMSYGADYLIVGGQAGRLAHKILQGAKPADLPIESAEKFDLVVNLKTAETIGVKVSDEFLAKTNRTIR